MVITTFSRIAQMKSFDNLFIELTSKNCNQHCNKCYIDFPKYKKEEDFLDINIIKNTLKDTKNENINCIYLTGAEPMTHPDFNLILRMCLKVCNVCICTNGSFINEKKARFLKKVEDESENEIFFKLSLVHYEELKNDAVRYRGAFRHTIFAVKSLLKYGFDPIISIGNYYKEPESAILNNFIELFEKSEIEINTKNFQISTWYNSEDKPNFENIGNNNKLDCQYGRVVTSNGIFTCPFLSNDYRGRSGSNLKDYSNKCTLESDYCITCSNSKGVIFGINTD